MFPFGEEGVYVSVVCCFGFFFFDIICVVEILQVSYLENAVKGIYLILESVYSVAVVFIIFKNCAEVLVSSPKEGIKACA